MLRYAYPSYSLSWSGHNSERVNKRLGPAVRRHRRRSAQSGERQAPERPQGNGCSPRLWI